MSPEYLLIRKAGTFVEAPPGIVDSVYDHQGKSEATNGGGGGVNCDIRIYREQSLKLFFSQSNWPEKLLFWFEASSESFDSILPKSWSEG